MTESLRLAECVLNHIDKNVDTYREYDSFLDKLLANLLSKVDKLNEPKLSQALGFFLSQLNISILNASQTDGKGLVNHSLLQARV